MLRCRPTLNIRHITHAPAGRILLVTWVVWLTAFAICKQRLWREPHSAFFQNIDDVYKQQYSDFRAQQGIKLIESENYTSQNLGTDISDQWTDKAEAMNGSSGRVPLICIAVVTVKRPTLQYLETTIGSMMAGLSKEERDALFLHVLFADTSPSTHPDWKDPWIRHIPDSFGTYNFSSEEERARIEDAENSKNWYVKGLFDYMYVLEKCLNDTNAPYIMIIEDDIVFAAGWMTRTIKSLQEIKHRTVPGQRWIYVRHFFTETSMRWRNEDFWFRNMYLTFGLAMVSGAGVLLLARRGKVLAHLNNSSVAVITFVTIPAFTALAFMIGKYTLMPLDGVVEMNRYGCCTQSMVYPRKEVPPLLAYFKMRRHGQTDTMIEEYADQNILTRYAIAPQVVQHVGLQSSRDNDLLSTKSTWAFWFETNDALDLERQHQADMAEIEWDGLLEELSF